MIDWFEGFVWLPHERLKGGLFADFDRDENGELSILRKVYKRIPCEGSHSTKFMVETLSLDTYDDLQQSYLDNLDKPIGEGMMPFLRFSGNPLKFLQGHNIFGVNDLNFLAYEVLSRCLIYLDLHHLIPHLRHSIDNNLWSITRVDITKMLQFSSDKDVDDYIYFTGKTSHIRSGNVQRSYNTLYFGKESSRWTFKIYNKLKELSSRSKKHRLPLNLENTGLIEFVTGQLRIELTLRKPELTKENYTNPIKLQKHINKIFNDYLDKIEMKNQHEIDNIDSLPPYLLATYLLWEKGIRLKGNISKSSYYRHRKELLIHGVDISNPPLNDDDKSVQFKTIKRVLEPKEVKLHHIPNHLLPYLAKPQNLILVA